MGTRNLTMVINRDGETKVAQYGQWDGYPSGQGTTILAFLLRITAENAVDDFLKKLNKLRFGTDDDQKDLDKFYKSIGANDGWMTMEQANEFKAAYPYLSRDTGGEILNLIMRDDVDVKFLTDSSDFANDSLFCEWAYVVDFQRGTFEVYEGFNKNRLTENERFYKAEPDNSEYQPISSFMTYQLNELPSLDEFVQQCEAKIEQQQLEEDN